MSKNTKKFDKKRSVTFQLVHRSQQDPLVADDTAPQRVLVPITEKEKKEKRQEEQHKYGIYYNDDCDYLEHLKDPQDHKVEWPEHVEEEIQKRRVRVELPATVFASEHEEPEGMLSKAAPISGPQLHLDPDVVAAMDEDFDYDDPENQLEDNFMQLADGVASDQEYDDEDFGSDIGSDDFGSDDNSIANGDNKSQFTAYSLTSSVIRRNDQLTLLDRRFDKMLDSYDDTQIGSLDCEVIEGHLDCNSQIMKQCIEEFENSKKKLEIGDHDLTNKIKQLVEKQQREGDQYQYIKMPQKPKWDCESFFSTFSYTSNRPAIIPNPPSKKKIKVSKKTGVPLEVIGTDRLTQRALDHLDQEYEQRAGPQSDVQSLVSQISMVSIRPKDETPEGRRERKKVLKELRRERRVEKKTNKLAFKEETKRQHKILLNNRNNLQGNTLM